jgi:hypothetical protein
MRDGAVFGPRVSWIWISWTGIFSYMLDSDYHDKISLSAYLLVYN